MSMRQTDNLRPLALGALAATVLGLLWRARPAPIASARVTAVTPGSPPVAHVALSYAPGARPVSVIIDVAGQGCAGSATLDGLTLYADLPLVGQLTEPLHVHTAAVYRILGLTITRST
jgi:hypothetical protein